MAGIVTLEDLAEREAQLIATAINHALRDEASKAVLALVRVHEIRTAIDIMKK